MPCPDSIPKKEEEDKVLKIFKRDEILELVYLKRHNPKEYKRTLRDVAGVLKDCAEIVDEVNK